MEVVAGPHEGHDAAAGIRVVLFGNVEGSDVLSGFVHNVLQAQVVLENTGSPYIGDAFDGQALEQGRHERQPPLGHYRIPDPDLVELIETGQGPV